MKKELEKLSKDELVLVANKQGLFGAEQLSKKELINRLLLANGYDVKEIQNKVKTKKMGITKLYMIIFVMISISILVMSISKIFTYYFFKDYSDFGTKDRYGFFLQVLSFAWTLFIIRSYWKHGNVNPFMLINIALSVGYFIFFMWDYGDTIKKVNKLYEVRQSINILNTPFTIDDIFNHFNLYKTLFYVWLGIVGFTFVIPIIIFGYIKLGYK